MLGQDTISNADADFNAWKAKLEREMEVLSDVKEQSDDREAELEMISYLMDNPTGQFAVAGRAHQALNGLIEVMRTQKIFSDTGVQGVTSSELVQDLKAIISNAQISGLAEIVETQVKELVQVLQTNVGSEPVPPPSCVIGIPEPESFEPIEDWSPPAQRMPPSCVKMPEVSVEPVEVWPVGETI